MHSSGRIFNMVTSDVEMLQMLCQSIMGIISSPLRIIIAMLLLYFQLGPAALVALAVLTLMMPMQVRVHRPSGAQPNACLNRSRYMPDEIGHNVVGAATRPGWMVAAVFL